MNDLAKIEEAMNILRDHKIVRSYRGKPGCGCGCKGSYSEAKAIHKKRVTAAEGIAPDYDCEIRIERHDINPEEKTYCDDFNVIVSFQTNETYIWFYVNTLGDSLL